jgi:hypothetical protein
VTRRLLIAAGVLTLGVAAEFALGAHLRQAGEQSYPVLLGRLESLHQGPNGRIVVRDPQNGQPIWIGKDMPEARDAILQKLYFKVEDVLVRVYQNGDGTQAQLYMVYTLIGEDRKHHPEICVRDAGGAPEDLRFRQEVPLAADGSASAMRFRFRTGAARSMVIYYWHYSPRPTLLDGQTAVQTIHQRIGVSAPSVTVQLTVYNDTPQALEAVERQLLPALHQEALQKVLPPGTETGCDRVPVRLARE